MNRLPISHRLAFYCAWICVVIGVLVIFGWRANSQACRELFLSTGEVQVNSGLLFLLFGLAIIWQPDAGSIRGWKRSWTCIGLGCLVSWLTLFEFWAEVNVGIDGLLIPEALRSTARDAGRMSDNSAFGFSFVGIALIALQGYAKTGWRPMFAGLLSCLCVSLAAFAVTGWFLALPTSFQVETVGPMTLPTGVGQLVLAIGLMALALKRSHRGGDMEVRWLPFALSVGVMTLACMFWLGIRLGERTQIRGMVFRAAVNVERLVAAEVEARMLTLAIVARQWESRKERTLADWEFDASVFQRHYSDVEVIAWINRSNVVQWVMTDGSKEMQVGDDVTADSRFGEFFKSARIRRHVGISSVFELKATADPDQSRESARSFVLAAPVVDSGEFLGFIAGVFRSEPMLSSLLTEVTQGFHLRVDDNGLPFYISSEVEEAVVHWARDGEVRLPESKLVPNGQDLWRLTVWPRRDTLFEMRSPLGTASVVGGAVLAVLLGLSVYFVQASREKTRELVTINRNLGDEVKERRQVQDALKESQSRLQAIMDNTSAVIYLKDAEGRYLLVNSQFERLFHLNKDEMIGRTDYDVFPKQMADSFRANDQRALDSSEPITIEEIAPHDDGLHTYISIKFPMMDGDENCVGVCGIATDITDRKVAEAKLRDSHQALELAHDRLRGILEGTQDRIVALDLKYRFLSFNSAFKQDFEQRYETKIRAGQRVVDVLGSRPDDLERLFDRWMRAMRGEQFEIEEQIREGDELTGYLEHRFSPIRSESGVLIGATQLTRDISERRRSELERNELLVELANRNDQLIAANKELEAFSYTVSHDLRAPIRHIDGFVQLLERHSGDDMSEKGARYLTLISDAAKRMGLLIDDLLSFSRMGRAEIRLAAVNMRGLIDEVRRELAPELEGRVIEWNIAELPPVHADASLIRQVWTNLLSNAVKYSRTREEAQIEIGFDDTKENEILYFVRDNGVGFNMKYVDRLFGVFQRLHTDTEFDGTGIGLATVRRIVHRHGGRTWAVGEVDKGATIYFAMPRLDSVHPQLQADDT